MKAKEKSEKAGLKLNIQNNEDHGIQSHHFMANRWGNNGNSDILYLLGLQNQIADSDSYCCHEIKTLAPWKKSNDKPRQHIKTQGHYFAYKSP